MQKALLTFLSTTIMVATLSAAETKTAANDDIVVAPTTKAKIHTGWYMGLGLGGAGYSDGDMGKDFEKDDNWEDEV